ncbi:MAG TPA: PDZ domain-containing protein [Myxococcota bacterium]|nr:PDZ domain-containing protein [Myxococcota bacterium]
MLSDARRMILVLGGIACSIAASCGGTVKVKPTGDHFYKNSSVRRCLQYDKEQMASQSQACWERLLVKIQGDRDFVEKAELSPADINKIRENANRSSDQSEKLRKEMEACLKLSGRSRDERIVCYRNYMKKHASELSRSQKFEIENSIAILQQSKKRAAGGIEATIEHAGKLLGMQLHQEREGIRIDSVAGDPGTQAGIREQGLIVAIDGSITAGLDSAERIAHLESCEDKQIVLLIRYGGLEKIAFARVEAICGKQPLGKNLWEVALQQETCSEAGAPEIALGLSWCYKARDGILEVEEVCADSPAAMAGVRQGQRYQSINGIFLLGKTPLQIAELLKAFPAADLSLNEVGGALQSPAPLKGPPLDTAAMQKCWQAIESTLDRGNVPEQK